MKAQIVLSMVLVVFMIGGCVPLPDVGEILSQVSVTGSGNVITKEFDLSGFDQVEVTGAFFAEITQGDSFDVVVRVDEKLEEYLRVQVAGQTLEVGMTPNLSILGTATRQVEITMPELTGLELSGATQGTISGFDSTADLTVEVSGASKLDGDIQAGDCSFDVSGASTVDLSGSGEGLVLDASGASTAKVNVSGRLDAEASGASHVVYLGNPTLGRIDSSGASSIEQG